MIAFSKYYNSVIEFYLPKNTEGIESYKLTQMKLTIAISVYGGIVAIVMALLRLSIEGLESKTWFLLFGASFLAIVVPLSIRFTNKYIWWPYFLCTAIAFVVTIRAISTGGTYGQAISWFYVIPVLGSLVLGIRGAIIVTLISVLGIWTVYYLPIQGIVEIGYLSSHKINAIVLSCGVVNIGLFCLYYEYQKDKHHHSMIKLEREIQAQEKFIGLSRISSGIAHEINNPLAIISLNLMSMKNQHIQLLKNDNIDRSLYNSLEKKTDNVLNAITQTNNIVRTLKDLMHSEKISDESIAIKHLVKIVLLELEELIKYFNISVETKYQNPNLEINRFVLERVINNLLRNSIDAISHQDIKWIQIDSSIMEDKVSISVTDSGTGIDKEVADRIFEPFYTTKDIGAGTGLGLGLCKTLLNQIGGDVHLNEEAANTAFIIKTPYSIGKCHGAQSNNY